MIKLAFMVDTAYVLGFGNKELPFQMDKITVGDHYVAGRKNLQFYKNNIFKSGTILYIVSRSSSSRIKDMVNIKMISDYMELVHKYKDSKDSLVVIGGKEILMLFLPYASEISVIITNKKTSGDTVFKEWKTFNLRLKKIEEWPGGITYYYSKKPAPVY